MHSLGTSPDIRKDAPHPRPCHGDNDVPPTITLQIRVCAYSRCAPHYLLGKIEDTPPFQPSTANLLSRRISVGCFTMLGLGLSVPDLCMQELSLYYGQRRTLLATKKPSTLSVVLKVHPRNPVL